MDWLRVLLPAANDALADWTTFCIEIARRQYSAPPGADCVTCPETRAAENPKHNK